MTLITPGYRAVNKELHAQSHTFGGSGLWWAFHAAWAVYMYNCKTALDYGCGKGSLAADAWRVLGNRAIPIAEYDPAISGKDSMPAPADLVVCTDVLEHVEPECINDVLEHIAALTKKIALFVISTTKAKKTLPDGRNAHLLVRDESWWDARLANFFEAQLKMRRAEELVIFARAKTEVSA